MEFPVGDPVRQYDEFFANRSFGTREDTRSPPLHFGQQFKCKIGILRTDRFSGLIQQIKITDGREIFRQGTPREGEGEGYCGRQKYAAPHQFAPE
jgi:hypothetical protein